MSKITAIKIIAVIQLVSMLFIPVTAAEISSPYDSAFEKLKAFGIVTDDIDTSQIIKRGEFARLVCKVINVSDNSASEIPFTDVDNSLLPSVSALLKTEIISNSEIEKFNPESPVKPEEAGKMLVIAAGYELKAQTRGGWPSGYLSVASELKILNGSVNAENGLTAGNALIMIYNTLNAPYAEQSAYGSSARIELDTTETVLAHFHKIYRYSGIVYKNSRTGLNSKDTAAEGKIQLKTGSAVLDMNDCGTGAGELLGYDTVVYAQKQDDNSQYDIKHISASDRNSSLEIQAEDLRSSSQFSKTNIIYKASKDKDKKANISLYADIIYNGISNPEYQTDRLFEMENGSVRLVDNNGDLEYDVIFIYEYYNLLVSAIDTENMVLYNKISAKALDLFEAEQINVFINQDNKRNESDLEKILTGDLISVFSDEDGKFISLEVFRDTVRGVIDELSYSNIREGYMDITVNGTAYAVNKDLIAYLDRRKETFSAGDGVLIITDIAKNAAYMEIRTGKPQFAYLMQASVGKNSLDEDNIKIKVITPVGDYLSYSFAKKVNFNGIHGKSGGDIIKSSEISDGSILKSQLIKIRINEEGKITELYTMKNGMPEDDDYDLNSVWLNETITNARFRSSNEVNAFSGKYLVDSSTVIFEIIEDGSGSGLSEDKCRVVGISEFKDNTLHDKIEIYNSTEYYMSGAVVRITTPDSITYNWGAAGVNKVSKCINDLGEAVYSIHCIVNGKEEKYLTKSLEVVEKPVIFKQGQGRQPSRPVKSGDIIRMVTNQFGEIYGIQIIAGASDLPLQPFAYDMALGGSPSSDLFFCYDTVAKIDNPLMMLKNSPYVCPFTSRTYIYRYNEEANTFKKVTAGVIYPSSDSDGNGSKVFVHKNTNAVVSVFVLN